MPENLMRKVEEDVSRRPKFLAIRLQQDICILEVCDARRTPDGLREISMPLYRVENALKNKRNIHLRLEQLLRYKVTSISFHFP